MESTKEKNLVSRMITIYTRSSCVPCLTIKRIFKNKGVEYIEKDVADQKNADELAQKYKVQTVPVTVFDDEPVIGLNLPVIMSMI